MVGEVSNMSLDESTQRQYPRVSAENAVLIHRLGPAAEEKVAKTRQIGLGGVMISSGESLGVDSYLRLVITVENEMVEATGRVVWERSTDNGSFDVGVAFISVDTAHHERIFALMPDEPVGTEQ